jgi:glycosyltransferase involved in cell wall biosynthesis
VTYSAKISVIIPTFNRPVFLKEAVYSVLAQTVPAYEILIIDDGSEANCQTLLKQLSESSPVISVHLFPVNRGSSFARNFGLKQARGDYICFLDDDDSIHPKLFESSLAYFEKDKDIDIVTCWGETFFTPDSRDSVCSNSHLFKYRGPDEYPLKKLFPTTLIGYSDIEKNPFSAILLFNLSINSCLIRKISIDRARFPEDLERGEDTYFWLSLALQGCRFKRNLNIYAYVRQHRKNSNSSQIKSLEDEIKSLNKLISDGMLRNKHDLFIVHSRLFKKLFELKQLKSLRHLGFLLKSPVLFLKYLYLYLIIQVRKKQNLL